MTSFSTSKRSFPPYLHKLPLCNSSRTIGTDTEFGTLNLRFANIESSKQFNVQGARIYVEKGHAPVSTAKSDPSSEKMHESEGHLELGTPPVTNILEHLRYERSGVMNVTDLMCEKTKVKYADALYKNTVDLGENKTGINPSTYGAHESYLVSKEVGYDAVATVSDFLITRIYAGSGSFNLKGLKTLTERSPFMNRVLGDTSMDRRPLVHIRNGDSDLGLPEGLRRQHLILGDANMCDEAIVLKIGTTRLVLDLLEMKKTPRFRYDPFSKDHEDKEAAIQDLHHLNTMPIGWGLKTCSLTALDIQRAYLETAIENLWNRDRITNFIIRLWSNVLDDLEHNPTSLIGRVDWATKFFLINLWEENAPDEVKECKEKELYVGKLLALSRDYHDTDPETGLFHCFANSPEGITHGEITARHRKLVSERSVINARNEPPKGVRAEVMGKAAALRDDPYIKDRGVQIIIEWGTVTVSRPTRSLIQTFILDDPTSPLSKGSECIKEIERIARYYAEK